MLFFKTKNDVNGGAWYLVVNLEKKIYHFSQNGSWNTHIIMKSKKSLVELQYHLDGCGFQKTYDRKLVF